MEVLDCQCWWFSAWRDEMYHSLALDLCPKVVSSVRRENIHSWREEKSSTDFQGGCAG